MAILDFLNDLPEDKRDAFKLEASKVVLIDSREAAAKMLRDHPLMKSAYDAEISHVAANIERKFTEEKLPKLLEEERKKGQKQPWELEIDKLKADLEADQKALALEKQRNRAMQKAQELDIPPALVDRFIGMTDEETDANLATLQGAFKPFVEDREKKIRAELLGNNPPGRRGADAPPATLETQYQAALAAGDMAAAIAIKSRLAQTQA